MILEQYTNLLAYINQLESQRGRSFYAAKIGKEPAEKIFKNVQKLLKRQDKQLEKLQRGI